MRQGINEPFNAPGYNRGPKDEGREEEEQEQWVNIRITLHLHSNVHQQLRYKYSSFEDSSTRKLEHFGGANYEQTETSNGRRNM